MKTTTFTLIMALLPTLLFGQGLLERAARRATQRVENKTEERINKKVDEKIDEGLDQIESSSKNKESSTQPQTQESKDQKSQQRTDRLFENLGFSDEPVEYKEQYNFDFLMKINIKTTTAKGKTKNDGDMITYISNKGQYLAYEFSEDNASKKRKNNDKGIFILDYENNSTIILSEDKNGKTAIAYSLGKWTHKSNKNQNESFDDEGFKENHNINPTGRTKKIHGFTCEEWVYNDDDAESIFWITKDYEVDSRDMFSSVFAWNKRDHNQPEGFMMESESKDLKSGDITIMKVLEINHSINQSFRIHEYEMTNLGSVGNF